MRTALILLLSILSSTFALAQLPKGHTIWDCSHYTNSHTDKLFAKDWASTSLPLGNGSLGANVMGYVGTEVYILNEKSLWTGGPASADGPAKYWDANKESAAVLKDIRRAFKAGDYERAQQLTVSNFDGAASATADHLGHYASLGRLTLYTGHKLDADSRYAYALSLDSAFAHVFYSLDGVDYERRSFISYPDNVLVIRCTASKRGMQHMRIAYLPGGESSGTTDAEGPDGLVFRGTLQGNGMAHVVRIRAIAQGGKVTSVADADAGHCLQVQDADEVLILLTADTDYAPNFDPDFSNPKAYVGVDPDKTTAKWMKSAAKKTYDKLFAAHLKDYKALYDRVELHIAEKGKPASAEPRPRGTLASETQPLSESRASMCLLAYRDALRPDGGVHDHGFEETYFQYGRYLLIASSRAGNLPANDCGLWSLGSEASAGVGYDNNLGLPMAYWPAFTCNLAECAQPFADYVHLLQKSGSVTARKYFNARGWSASAAGNPFGFTAPLSGQTFADNFNPVVGPALAASLWEQYAFTDDMDFLRNSVYPVLKASANFCCDYLWQKDDGTLTAAPSVTPGLGSVDAGATYAHGVIHEVLAAAISAATVLNTDGTDINIWTNNLIALAPYPIGAGGQLQEWSLDIDGDAGQQHTVAHLFGLHPGSSISPILAPDIAEGARVALERSDETAADASAAWRINQWARLHDGNRSYRALCGILRAGTNEDNAFNLLPPFSASTHIGATAGIAEMFLQSHAQCLHLLPALPAAWSEGSVKGLRARGAFVVDINWADGELTSATVKSLSGGVCSVRYGDSSLDFETTAGKTYSLVLYNGYLRIK